MRFPFKQVSYGQAFVSIGGRNVRPRPLVNISLIGPKSTFPEEARIDSGSDDSLFPERVASLIGVDLSHAPFEVHRSQSQGMLRIRFAKVTLRLTDGVEFREWPAWVGFALNLRRSVLGFGGCMQFFTTTLFGDDEVVELTINRLYPGT